MTSLLFAANFINWNPDLIAFHAGPLTVRWYSLCWLIGLLLAYMTVKKLYKEQGESDEKFEPLFFYCFIGILIGARLGHCIFYQADYFLASAKGVFEMFIPVRLMGDGVIDSLTSGAWHFIGYEGLASHGGTAGIILALVLYARNMKMPILRVVDYISIATPITCTFIRLGNLMNSEIIGKPTDMPWAFIFERVDMLPRHPGQLYEAIAYFILYLIMWKIYRRTNSREVVDTHLRTNFSSEARGYRKHTTLLHSRLCGTGFFFGLVLFYIYTFRFFIELTKENQEAFENGMLFNMGQLLSVPFIIIGAIFMWRGMKKSQSPS